MNAGYVHNRLMEQAIYKEAIREVKEKIQIGDRLPVKIFKDESFTRTHVGSVVVGRVVSKHKNLVCLDIGTSVTYVQIAMYLRAKQEDPTGKHYIK